MEASICDICLTAEILRIELILRQNFAEIGQSAAELWLKTIPPSWISCDVILLHQGIHFQCPNIVLNFYVDCFSSF